MMPEGYRLDVVQIAVLILLAELYLIGRFSINNKSFIQSHFVPWIYYSDVLVVGILAIFGRQAYKFLAQCRGGGKVLHGPFDPSAPIRDTERDMFMYKPLARDVAQFLARGSTPSPLTVGIEGSFGSGKTSFIQLLKADPCLSSTVIMEFAPWHSSTIPFHEQLLDLLADATGPSDNPLAQAMRHYAKELSKTSFGRGAILTIRGARNLELRTATNPKAVVDKLMRESGNSYLVIIDDIDRLLPDEIVEILRLIRNTADFSNVRYLIAYDRGVLSAAIDSVQSTTSRYIDKIVPVEVALPHVASSSLADYSLGVLSELLPNVVDGEDLRRLRDRSRQTLGMLLATPRDAVRAAYAVSLSYGRLARNIDLHDAIIIGALRLRYPELVRSIANRRELLFMVPENQSGRNRWMTLATSNMPPKTELELMLEGNVGTGSFKQDDQRTILAVMKDLFEYGGFVYEHNYYSVRNVSIFHQYFGFNLSEHTIPEEDYFELLSAEVEKQDQHIRRILESGKALSLHQRLEFERKKPNYELVELLFKIARAEIKSEPNWTKQVASFFFQIRDRLVESGPMNQAESERFRARVIALMNSGEYPFEYERRICEGVLSEVGEPFVLSKAFCEGKLAEHIEDVINKEQYWNSVVDDVLSDCFYRGWEPIRPNTTREQRMAINDAKRLIELARLKFGNKPYARWFLRSNSPSNNEPILYALNERAQLIYNDWGSFEQHLRSLLPDPAIKELLELHVKFKATHFNNFVQFEPRILL
jgi:hypothetical protein